MENVVHDAPGVRSCQRMVLDAPVAVPGQSRWDTAGVRRRLSWASEFVVCGGEAD